MTSPRDIDRVLVQWMDDGPTLLADRVIAAALSEIPTTRQRGARWAPLKELFMTTKPAATIIGIAAAIVLGIAAYQFIWTGGLSIGRPDESTAPVSTPGTVETSEAFSVPLSLDLPSGWQGREAAAFYSVFRPPSGTEPLFDRIVFADPASMRVTAAAGAEPWPDDLYAWLDGRPEFEPSQPQVISVGGRPATMIEAVADYEPTATRENLPIIQIGPSSPTDGTLVALTEGSVTWRLIEVDLGDGAGVVIIYLGATDTFDAWAAEVEEVLDTVRFE
ncbi:MAG: hypothetical protein ACRDGD_06230 [Candidatus Limnocylindria bacterium]